MLTDYHAKYFAHELNKRCPSDSIEKLAGALVDALVDLNPHQIEAALFDTPDEIDRRRERLIAEIEGKLQQKITTQELFAIRWKVACISH
jgi:hypothetical protein